MASKVSTSSTVAIKTTTSTPSKKVSSVNTVTNNVPVPAYRTTTTTITLSDSSTVSVNEDLIILHTPPATYAPPQGTQTQIGTSKYVIS